MPKQMTLARLMQTYRALKGEEAAAEKGRRLLDVVDEMAAEVAQELNVDAGWPRLHVDASFPDVALVPFYPRVRGQQVPPLLAGADLLDLGSWEPMILEEEEEAVG